MAAEAVISGMDPIMRAIVTISVLIFFAKIFASAFSSLRLPSVIGELLAGIVLGPYALGSGIKIFGEPLVVLNEYVDVFAEIGAIMILFSIGLEMGLASLKRTGVWAVLVATGGALLPFIAGYQLYLYLGAPHSTALMIGAVMVATSLAISVRILDDFHALKTDEGSLLVNSAVIDDVLGVVILAVISSIVAKGGVMDIYSTLTMTATFFLIWILMIIVGAYILPRVIEQATMLRTEGAVEAAAIGSAFIMAAIAGALGLSPVVGSYAAGMAVAESRAHPRIKDFIRHINQIFSPVFFTVLGAKMNIMVFSGEVLIGTLILTAIAIITKFAGCFLAALVKLRDLMKSVRLGVGMIPRGEIGLIIAAIGLKRGVLPETIYMESIGMVIITSLIAPIILSKLYEAIPTEAEAVLE